MKWLGMGDVVLPGPAVWVTDEVVRFPEGVRFVSFGQVQLKGMDNPVHLHRAERQ